MAGWFIHLSLSPVPILLSLTCSHGSGDGGGRARSLGRVCSRGCSICCLCGDNGEGKEELKREESNLSEFSFSKVEGGMQC